MIINSGGDSYRKGNLTLLWGGGGFSVSDTPEAFTPQTIPVDITNYEMIYIVSAVSTTTKEMIANVIINDPSVNHLIGLNSGTYTYTRTVTLADDGITFSTGQRMINDAVNTVGDTYVIPIAIYGY